VSTPNSSPSVAHWATVPASQGESEPWRLQPAVRLDVQDVRTVAHARARDADAASPVRGTGADALRRKRGGDVDAASRFALAADAAALTLGATDRS